MKNSNELEKKVKEYLKAYPHLRNPATIDLLRETVKAWQHIKLLEKLLEQSDKPAKLILQITGLKKVWLSMLGNLGITFTRQQYRTKKKTVQPPIERLKMLTKKGKKNGKT